MPRNKGKVAKEALTRPKARQAPLRDKNAVTGRKPGKKTSNVTIFSCLPGGRRLDVDKINKAIINDDVKKLDEIISNNPDALDHVDDKGKTLLHQCVDNCAKYGVVYSNVALHLIERGCSLELKDEDNATVLQDAHEQRQHLLLSQMIKKYKECEIVKGRRSKTQPIYVKTNAGNGVIFVNIRLYSYSPQSKLYKKLGDHCEAYLSTEGSTHVHIVNQLGTALLTTTMTSIKQLQKFRNKPNRVLMQLDSDGVQTGTIGHSDSGRILVLEFDNQYDAYHFSSMISSRKQLEEHARDHMD